LSGSVTPYILVDSLTAYFCHTTPRDVPEHINIQNWIYFNIYKTVYFKYTNMDNCFSIIIDLCTLQL